MVASQGLFGYFCRKDTMATLLAFAGSNSSKSVNLKLVRYTVSKFSEDKTQILNLANMPFPMYSEDQEREAGFSNSMIEFKDDIQKADGLIISVNEHNSYISAYFKNLLDWLSRLDRDFIRGKKILLMSTSPGKRGAIGALEVANNMLTRFGAEVVTTFSLPSFHTNFDAAMGITDLELAKAYQEAISQFSAKL